MENTAYFTRIQLAPDLWRFKESMGGFADVDAYLVVGTKRAALIDALQSEQPVSLADQIREITDLPVDVLLTHGHPDHAGAALRTLAATSGFTLYLNKAELPMAQGMYAPWMTPDMFRDVSEGDVFDLGGSILTAYRVAGHTPGSMVFLDRRNKRCFTGDAFGVWLQLEHSLPMKTYVEELGRFEKELADIPDTVLWIGHSIQSPDGYFKADHVTNMREACDMVLSGELKGENIKFPPELEDSPMAEMMKTAKIARYKTVTGLTYREDWL